MFFKIIVLLLFCINIFAGDNGLAYLNEIRKNAKLNIFSLNTKLSNAAKHHAYYLKNNLSDIGHYENISSSLYYSGYFPSDRAINSGYKSINVSENLSLGQRDIKESIDTLMSAIYHRHTFLAFDMDEVGIGKLENAYVFDLGNSLLNTLCSYDSFSAFHKPYYIGLCSNNEFKISVSDYNSSYIDLVSNNPLYVIWPSENSVDIPPVFFEETPDPLPNYSVSGYPISISFNNYFVKSVNLISFELYDENNNQFSDVLLMDRLNDPNKHFSDFDFALFPLQRLEYGRKYRVKIVYSINSQPSQTLIWNFKTRDIDKQFYKLTMAEETLSIKANTTYAIYFEPSHANDKLGNFSYNLPHGLNYTKFDYIDEDTLLIEISADEGQSSTITFSNGRTLKLFIE